MRFRTILAAGFAAVAALSLGAAAAQAQSYPTKPVTLVVPFPPGGATDAIARFVAEGLTGKLGQQVIVENIPGANGGTGTAQVVAAEPDGYTLVIGSSGVQIVNPLIYKDITYDALKDFTAVAPLTLLDSILIISNRLNTQENVKTVQDLLAYAKANPGKLNFGSGGIGNTGHLAGELFAKQAGIDMEFIPFQGGAAATQALVAGDIDLIFSTTPESLPVIRAGTAVPLAVMSKNKLEVLPDVPTISEIVPGAEIASFQGIFGPAGVPSDVVAKLETAVQEVLSTDKAKAFFDNLSVTRNIAKASDLAAMVAADKPRLTELVKSLNLETK